MTQFPEDTGFPPTEPGYPAGAWSPPPRTSGFAIASLIFGLLGLVSCCTIFPSLLGAVFGFISLSIIRRGEAAGRGLGIAGIILSLLGLILGLGFWTMAALSPDNTPRTGVQMSEKDVATLRAMNVVQPGEQIELFCASGTFSIKEGGVVLTDGRLVVYGSSGAPRSVRLQDIEMIDFTPAESWIGDGHFTVVSEDGQVLTFTVDGMEKGDRLFHRTLERRVAQVREDAGKTPPATSAHAEDPQP